MVLCLLSFSQILSAQKETIKKTKIVIGISSPELLHAGATYRLANISQIGLNVGGAPSLGGIWPSASFEHRLYIGKNSEKSDQKTWYFRQGTTFFFTLPTELSGNATV